MPFLIFCFCVRNFNYKIKIKMKYLNNIFETDIEFTSTSMYIAFN